MGFFEWQAARLVRRARPRIAPYLDGGETVKVAAIAREGSPHGPVILSVAIAAVLYPVLAVLGFENSGLTVGLSISMAVAVTVAVAFAQRSRWIVLTERRVLFFRVHPFRLRPTAFVESHARWVVRRIGNATSLGWRGMTYCRPTGSSVALGFGPGWRSAYEQLRRALAPAQP